MNIRKNYNHTLNACYLGYITQAIVNNFAPLLFLTFQSTYEISLDKIALLVSFNFGVQLIVDLLAAKYVDKIGYRNSVVAAHIFGAVGLVGLAVFPSVFPDAYAGLLLAVFCYAIGGGLIEVLISPIVESCPTERKAAAMSLLHSFYCWGHVGVILISTAFFAIAGIENWRILAVIWAILPALNAVYFGMVPIQALLCNWRRIDRSADQPDCRILSDRAKGCCDESSAFFLLLGACRRDSDLNCIFCHCRD